MRSIEKGQSFIGVINDTIPERAPVFSETFLYKVMSKDDARFILAIANEYDKLIRVLTPDVVVKLLERY